MDSSRDTCIMHSAHSQGQPKTKSKRRLTGQMWLGLAAAAAGMVSEVAFLHRLLDR